MIWLEERDNVDYVLQYVGEKGTFSSIFVEEAQVPTIGS